MSEKAAYNLLVDWDRDGFFCQGVLTTDALNLVPSPVTYHGLFLDLTTSNSSVQIVREATTFGRYTLLCSNGGDLNGGVRVGRNATLAVNQIPVMPSTGYTAQVWIQLISTTGSANLRIQVTDESGATLNTSDITITSSYVAYHFGFTTGATTRLIRFTALKVDTTDTMVWRMGGVMIVAGATAPSAFNAGAVSNAYDDLISFVESLSASYGIPQYTEAVAPAASFAAVLNNATGLLSPENSSSVYSAFWSRGMLIQLQAAYSGATYPLFIGTLDSLRADVGAMGGRRLQLTAVDPVSEMDNAQVYPALQTNVTTDQVLQAVFDSGVILYPYPEDYWLLDVSPLDVDTWLFDNTLTNFEVGDTTLAFAGDTTGAGNLLTVSSFLRDSVYAELGGRFFWDAPSAQFKFFKRTHDILSTASTITPLAIELDDPPQYIWGDDLLNRVTVVYYPRVVGAAGSVLFTQGNLPLALAPNTPFQTTIRYQIASAPSATVAGIDMITPIANLDYTVTLNQDGTGGDAIGFLTVVASFHATSADLTFVNSNSVDIYLQAFQVRGTPLTAYQAAQASSADGASIIAHGQYQRTVDLPALGDGDLAATYAGYLVQRYKTPLGRISTAALWANRDATTMTQVLGMTVGSYLRLADAFLQNQTQTYVVTAITHQITPTDSHWLRLTVEPLARGIYWILDDPVLSVLDSTTRLTF